jgi:magnesium transporter
MIRTLYYAKNGRVQTDVKVEQFADLLTNPQGLLWVDFEAEPTEVCEPILRDPFKFHPLAIDDALRESHVPKIDDWEQYLYIALHAITFEDRPEIRVGSHEFDIFLGKNFLVSHHEQALAAVERVRNRCLRDVRHLNEGADHVVYLIADELVADYMLVYDRIDECYDAIEDEIFQAPRPATLERILQLKRAVLKLRRTIAPQREVLNKLARDPYDVIDFRDQVFFRDVYDHLVRLFDINESTRDQIGGAMETYLSVINNRMNDVMKILTVITTLFMPISFISGFFGMNFFSPILDLKAWTGGVAFFLAITITCVTPLAMLFWFRHKGWLLGSLLSKNDTRLIAPSRETVE